VNVGQIHLQKGALAIMKWGFATTNEIKDLGPSFIADDFKDLMTFFLPLTLTLSPAGRGD
jgi:hypothetical protein